MLAKGAKKPFYLQQEEEIMFFRCISRSFWLIIHRKAKWLHSFRIAIVNEFFVRKVFVDRRYSDDTKQNEVRKFAITYFATKQQNNVNNVQSVPSAAVYK